MSKSLTRVINWGHELLEEKISEGQLAVDLTAGNGYDTLMLSRLVGPRGQVLAFDIQLQALQKTQRRLAENAVKARLQASPEQPLRSQPGVDLILAGHEQLADYLPAAPQAVIANLGYLPGSDQAVVTRPASTVAALTQACQHLQIGGRLAVVVYPGHPGGESESRQVDQFFAGLSEQEFQVLRIQVVNRSQAPYLLVAEKRRAALQG